MVNTPEGFDPTVGGETLEFYVIPTWQRPAQTQCVLHSERVQTGTCSQRGGRPFVFARARLNYAEVQRGRSRRWGRG